MNDTFCLISSLNQSLTELGKFARVSANFDSAAPAFHRILCESRMLSKRRAISRLPLIPSNSGSCKNSLQYLSRVSSILERYFYFYSGIPISRTFRGKANWFEKSGVKLQCLTEERERLLVRVIGRFEKMRVREIGIPL